MPADSVPVFLNRDNNGPPSDKLLVATENNPLLATTSTTVNTNKDFPEQNMQQINETTTHAQESKVNKTQVSVNANSADRFQPDITTVQQSTKKVLSVFTIELHRSE
ncbi:unnamed protein product [Rotaria sordida]|uniref:Uncharacterized protein n=1 Tax=Rotaria sordida TaxID=392033 RepID=A0A814W7H4_9BILA|nr:unnamed protein product [Rotaria sordida]CAF1333482.1 unnamed protein product [Rotaria sordida]